MDALEGVARGGTAMDPAVISKLSNGSSTRRHSPSALMAEWLSNQAIGRRLFLSESAIGKYTTSMFGKLGITDDDDNNHRVLAYLNES
ncbi:hypothetical protein [Nonomuraea aridisoli]|uniref:hypothetical protein n=1 Tax=Nonomuraea aridisoli TaxID=2070368 RepID=UPI001C64F576|nr:hypothetical protein [Nonomuraea aridisoli]